MNTFFLIMLQTEAQQGSPWSGIIMILLVFVVMWLFMIRPQQKKQKELEKQRNEMKPGDKVVTAGGLHGKIEKIQDDTMLVEIAKGVSIRIDKTSVFVEPQPEVKKTPAKAEDKKEDAKIELK